MKLNQSDREHLENKLENLALLCCPPPPCSRLFLIRGVPGSGKTTYAKTLGIADHYEADMWFDRNGGYDPAKLKQAHEWCQRKAIAAMRSGRDVVVSNTFTRLWEMNTYQDAAKKLGVLVIEVVMTGEWDNVHGVPAEKVRQMRERFEYANNKQINIQIV